MVGFRSVSLFSARKQETLTQGGTREIDQPTLRKTKGAGIVKGSEGKRDRHSDAKGMAKKRKDQVDAKKAVLGRCPFEPVPNRSAEYLRRRCHPGGGGPGPESGRLRS